MELKYYLRGLGLGIIVTAVIMGFTNKSRTMTDAEIISRAKQLGMTQERTLTDTVSDEGEASDAENAGGDGSDAENAGEDGSDAENADEDSPDEENADADGVDIEAVNADNTDADHADTGSDIGYSAAGDSGGSDAENSAANDRTETGNDEDISAAGSTGDAVDEETPGNGTADRSVTSNDPMVITIGSGDGSYAVSRKLADVGAVSSAESFDTFLCQNGYDKKIRTGTYTIPADASEEQMARIITGAE